MLDENVLFTPETEYSEATEITAQTKIVEASEPTKRTTTRQRKESMAEYRQMFLTPPKIVDRQTIFISRDLRDRIDRIVRQIGDRKLSVSGFAQNRRTKREQRVLAHFAEQGGGRRAQRSQCVAPPFGDVRR